MKNAKKLYILPGFGESVNDIGYKNISSFAKKEGYIVIPVPLVWNHRTASHWLKQFEKLVEKNGEDAVVLGFSFGAYIAVLASKDFEFKKLIVCSLSPYFSDDLSSLPKLAFNILKKHRMNDFKTHNFPTNVTTPVIFFVGTKDIPLVLNRVKKAYKTWKGNKKIIYISKVRHEIEAPAYLKAIYKELKKK